MLANLHRVKGKEKRPVKTGRLQFVLHLAKCLVFLCQGSLGGGQHRVLVEGTGQPGVDHGLHGGQLIGPQRLVGHDSGSTSGKRLKDRTLTRGSATRQAQSTSDRDETSSQMRRRRAAVADQVYDHDRSAAAVAIRAAPTGSSRIDATQVA